MRHTPAVGDSLRPSAARSSALPSRARLAGEMGEESMSVGPAREANAVVVGGGIWGCSIAYHLAQAGLTDVVVLERRELACGNTPQAAGLVGQLRASELMCRAIQGVVSRLTGWARKHGEDSGFRQVGSLKLALTEA